MNPATQNRLTLYRQHIETLMTADIKSTTPNHSKGLDRKKLIQLIHVAKSQLHLDDDTYRASLIRITSKNSTKAMTIPELNKVLDDFKTKGFKVAPQKAGKLKKADDDQSKLIRHLWLSLHALGEVRDPRESALANYVKRQTGVQFLQWLTMSQASTVIESLKKWEMRILKPRAKAVLAAIQKGTIDHEIITSELLKWLISTGEGKYKAISETNYATFIQTYAKLQPPTA
nr:regulatory protein GemA [Moraxella osloensis]